MVALDNMVVTVALPALRASLHGSLSDLEWTLNAYLLSFACWPLTGAALGDRFGRRCMFCAGLAVFTAASAWAALAPTAGVLIAARAVQGADWPSSFWRCSAAGQRTGRRATARSPQSVTKPG